MKTLALILVAAATFGSQILFSQGCLPEGITFTTQAEIDNFQANYPGCTEIEGDVTITSSNINNLNGLIVLTSIVGQLWFVENGTLLNFNGLNNLESLGGLQIGGFDRLKNVTGFENLTTIEGPLFVGFNDSIINLAGLNSLTHIGLDVNIGLNPNLMDLTGLENLLSIGGNLTFYDNDSLYDLSALNNLTSIGGSLNFIDNEILTSLSGIDCIDPNSIINLSIYNNPNLAYCSAQSICDYLYNPNGTVEIYGNDYGCDNEIQIINVCWISIKETEELKEIKVSPNPATSFITLTSPGDLPIEEVVIYNPFGQKILTAKPVNNTVDVSGLKAGIYTLEVMTKECRACMKLMVE